MKIVGIREFSRSVSGIVEQVVDTRQPVLISRRGQPVAALVHVDQQALEDLILGNMEQFVADLDRADADLVAGRAREFDDVVEELREDGAA